MENTQPSEPRSSVGSLLRATRLRAGEDLDQISSILRIRRTYVAAIEDSNYQALPGAAYAVGFVRAYAEYLGLDSEEVVRRFRAESAGSHANSELRFPSPMSDRGIPGAALMFVGVIVALIAYGGWYLLTSENKVVAELVGPLPDRLAALLNPQAADKPADTPPASQTVDTTAIKEMPPASTAMPDSTATSAEAPAAASTAVASASTPASVPAGTAAPNRSDTPSVQPTPQPATATTAPSTAPSPNPSATSAGTSSASSGTTPAPPTSVRAASSAPTSPNSTAATGTPARPSTSSAASATTTPSRPTGTTSSSSQITAAAPPASSPPAAASAPASSQASSPAQKTENTPAPTTSPASASATPAATASSSNASVSTAASAAASAPATAAAMPTSTAQDSSADTTEPDASDSDSTPPPERLGSDPAPATVASATPAPSPVASAPTTSAAPRPQATTTGPRIVVRAKMPSWIQVRDETKNELLVTRMMRTGDTYAVPDQPGLTLMTGNAGALEIIVDGTAAPAVGPLGAVRRNVALDAKRLLSGTAAGE